MFQYIIHNTDCPLVKQYNLLITQKPKTGTLAEKIEAQRAWRAACQALLDQIRKR